MSSVLTLQLAGPLQSWGASARFARRTTENAPTKSGVVGLLAAAKGLPRDADLSELAALRFGVRIDQPGTRLRDFQTAHHAVTGASMPLSERFYLADAVFVAAVEGGATLIDELHRAVANPAYLPYLGRRSCPPSRPVELAVHEDAALGDVLAAEPWRAAEWYQQRRRAESTVELSVLAEAGTADGWSGAGARSGPSSASEPRPESAVLGDTIRDQPLSFDPRQRRFALRTVLTSLVTVPNPCAAAAHTRIPDPRGAAPAHDPISHLEHLEGVVRCT
ncbi:type I-E CRISPR-associated protein Cas5/CasD [Streptacidiphilus cavernicola]|uniref:Type I-E CRISPR-associated protein Cas5/CasD n=1 Tax=Streptacidiphilus cavernicola TaxID=3342716 RepID=A0ABV6W4D5_9ACTN